MQPKFWDKSKKLERPKNMDRGNSSYGFCIVSVILLYIFLTLLAALFQHEMCIGSWLHLHYNIIWFISCFQLNSTSSKILFGGKWIQWCKKCMLVTFFYCFVSSCHFSLVVSEVFFFQSTDELVIFVVWILLMFEWLFGFLFWFFCNITRN